MPGLRIALALSLATALTRSGDAVAQDKGPGGWFKGENLMFPAPTPADAWKEERFEKTEGLGTRLVRWRANDGRDEVQVLIFFGLGRARGDEAFDRMCQGLGEEEARFAAETCAGEATAPSARSDRGGYRLRTSSIDCPTKAGGHFTRLMKVLEGRDALYMVRREWRATPKADDLADWRRRLEDVRLCDTRRDDAACPTDMGPVETAASPRLPTAALANPPTLTFGGKPFVHRWSRSGHHEFTPPDQPDTERAKELLGITVIVGVDGPAGLATANQEFRRSALAGGGRILESKTIRPPGATVAEHFLAVVHPAEDHAAAVCFHLFLREGRGVAVALSRFFKGDDQVAAATAWLTKHQDEVEASLIGWDGLPKFEVLDRLTQPKP